MRHRRLTAAAVLALLAGATTGLSGCACSTVAYLYSGPAVVEFDRPLPEDATVSACFSEGCEPARIAGAGDDGQWVVPQEPPYSNSGPAMGPSRLRVVVVNGDVTVADNMHDIPTSSEPGYCPGKWKFETLRIDVEEE